ncbi:hypothetical protein BEL04_04310 [Mucilaginibacter sp. PPCGB 2223]|uniref:hypothetical protein n=1 Tax=Mucilaginibacter sp. PPCGB 2223 TaxID=1886027 RepID=UPI000826AB03|nr:hypothetical protein [Mucilaginibacter sp. PPCGB 2223]OCX53528.1 hypothetical protein BEL04_04310 [Mucilaginibacter sp. PPCGB 2223]
MGDQTLIQANVQEVPGLQEIYLATKHWLDDLLFFDDEAKFLNILLEKYFAVALHQEHVNRIQLINDHLKRVCLHKQIIKDEVITHRTNLDNTLKNNMEKREDFLYLEHNRLAEEIKDLNQRFKNVKNDIFQITELLLIDQKLQSHAE